MEYRILGKTGLKVTTLSFGASSLGGAFRDVEESEGIRAVHLSLDMGINFLDVSPFYGLTKAETVLGKALKGVPRDKYILETKCGRYGQAEFDFSAQRATASVEESLGRLGIEYIDVLLCHDIEFVDLEQVITETIPALRKVQKAGKIGHVGISGLPLKIFKAVPDRVDVDALLSYCHFELNDDSLTGLIPYFKSKGIGIVNASPLGMGLLSNRGTPDWHPAPAKVKEVCAKAAAHCKAKGANIEKLALQYAISHPEIATTLVGSGSSENMRRNITWANEPIDEQLLAETLDILKPIHNVTWSSGKPENN
jgi:L-galactose dehydrogenase